MEKTFKGKAIYNPKVKAAEYAKWACNFYVGCSNGCEYCYCKKGRSKAIMGGDVPTLKKCFKDMDDAMQVFINEAYQNREELQKHGLFFSFTTDPMLPETIELTKKAFNYCMHLEIPVKILTKRTDWILNHYAEFAILKVLRHKVAFGFTLTGHDELEPGASTNAERIEAMKKLHDAGFKTWASIEPIINLNDSFNIILDSSDYCDLYKIGLESGKKHLKRTLISFINCTTMYFNGTNTKTYFKDSFLKQAGIERSSLPANYVDRDYNIFGV